ncbi:LOW-TEMPERATURE-INDUCED PROTEIN [Salix koriyanagi]|uniref:LOW-TEMPERATURE-INDUCED PROTEIN n=1 Tax=Salix koriyanagi TaxID=2511006 RepID=A0A9Q0X5G9_9ROSI|nr:LOW-TEMPERATURE-INDUCED PROTEIN [Salix koriyanagi]KAJ6777760.1 LOW-TEMPERATURE-INDUCED PROTEIN [Salix koriyanagi]
MSSTDMVSGLEMQPAPTVEELLQAEEVTRLSPHTTPTICKDHELEYDQSPSQKKSVITKVKEKAKKWRSTLSKKKHNDDDNTTPSWGVSLDDAEDEEDPEYLGAPMYESEMAPERYKETARQNPRAVPVISEAHVLPGSMTCAGDKPVTKTVSEEQENEKSPKTLTQTVAEKLAPAYSTVSVGAHAIASKIQSLAISAPETVISETHVLPSSVAGAAEDRPIIGTGSGKQENEKSPKTLTETVAEKLAPAYNTIQSLAISALETPGAAGLDPVEGGRAAEFVAGPTKVELDQVTSDPSRAPVAAASGEQKWDEGVSVKESLIHKSGPGEDDKSPSQVTSQATGPWKTAGDVSVVNKVGEAVDSLLPVQESSQPAVFHSAKNSSSDITISTVAHEVTEEENHGRILQAN